MNSPISWLGGKKRLRNEIIKRFPIHECYVEVFGGGAWVLFGKKPVKVEVYNDLDGELVNFFKVIKNDYKIFLNEFKFMLVSRRIFNDLLNSNTAELNDIQRALRFFYIIKTSYGSKWESPCFGYSKTSTPNLNLKKLNDIALKVHARLNKVYIEEGDFQEIIKRYDGIDTLFYLDPPYYNTAGYKHNMAIHDYERLFLALKKIKGKFLLSINDNDEMRKLFSGFEVEETEVLYTISRNISARRRHRELIVKNFT